MIFLDLWAFLRFFVGLDPDFDRFLFWFNQTGSSPTAPADATEPTWLGRSTAGRGGVAARPPPLPHFRTASPPAPTLARCLRSPLPHLRTATAALAVATIASSARALRAAASPFAAVATPQTPQRLPEYLLVQVNTTITLSSAAGDRRAAPSAASLPSLPRPRRRRTGHGGRRRGHRRVRLVETKLAVSPRPAAVVGSAGEAAREAAARFEFTDAGARVRTRSNKPNPNPLSLPIGPVTLKIHQTSFGFNSLSYYFDSKPVLGQFWICF